MAMAEKLVGFTAAMGTLKKMSIGDTIMVTVTHTRMTGTTLATP